jgi:excisionase family DNA binding protein
MEIRLLTEKDLKDMLKITDRQAAALIRTKGFPFCKIGRTYRVKEDALNRWIDSNPSIKLDYSKTCGNRGCG